MSGASIRTGQCIHGVFVFFVRRDELLAKRIPSPVRQIRVGRPAYAARWAPTRDSLLKLDGAACRPAPIFATRHVRPFLSRRGDTDPAPPPGRPATCRGRCRSGRAARGRSRRETSARTCCPASPGAPSAPSQSCSSPRHAGRGPRVRAAARARYACTASMSIPSGTASRTRFSERRRSDHVLTRMRAATHEAHRRIEPPPARCAARRSRPRRRRGRCPRRPRGAGRPPSH